MEGFIGGSPRQGFPSRSAGRTACEAGVSTSRKIRRQRPPGDPVSVHRSRKGSPHPRGSASHPPNGSRRSSFRTAYGARASARRTAGRDRTAGGCRRSRKGIRCIPCAEGYCTIFASPSPRPTSQTFLPQTCRISFSHRAGRCDFFREARRDGKACGGKLYLAAASAPWHHLPPAVKAGLERGEPQGRRRAGFRLGRRARGTKKAGPAKSPAPIPVYRPGTWRWPSSPRCHRCPRWQYLP